MTDSYNFQSLHSNGAVFCQDCGLHFFVPSDKHYVMVSPPVFICFFPDRPTLPVSPFSSDAQYKTIAFPRQTPRVSEYTYQQEINNPA